MEFSLSYFSAGGPASTETYRLVVEGARFADAHGFTAVWLPERHFQEFGGLYPNPAVLAAAIATVTRRVRIRAGSVVLPLHDPLRVAEEWAVVDNLSDGRVDVSFASGWHPADFVLSRARYEDRRQVTVDGVGQVRRLWAGHPVSVPGPDGRDVEVSVFPRPVQPTLPIWITTSGTRQTWDTAGRLGTGVLAALIGESVATLEKNIALYRGALADAGHPSSAGHVTVMMHTFLGPDAAAVRAQARPPLHAYVRAYMRQKEDPSLASRNTRAGGPDVTAMSDAEKDELSAFALGRFFQGNALLGRVEDCAPIVERLGQAGVDEIACLIDFGIPPDDVLGGLPHLNALRLCCAERR